MPNAGLFIDRSFCRSSKKDRVEWLVSIREWGDIEINSDLQKIRVDVTVDADQNVINPDFVRVYKQCKNIIITFEGYTRKYLLANYVYKLGILNYEGTLPRIKMPILITNGNGNIHVGYFDISSSDHVVSFRTPNFLETDNNYVSGSHIVYL